MHAYIAGVNNIHFEQHVDCAVCGSVEVLLYAYVWARGAHQQVLHGLYWNTAAK